VTGLVWAFGTVVWAALGDRYGRRPVIAVCTIMAAVFSWVTGFVQTVGQMLTIRGFLGLFEGGPYAPAMGTLAEEVPEHRRAMNAGLVTGSFMLVGVCLGSQVAVWLLEKFGSWRQVFYVVSTPALVIGILLFFMMREAPSVAEAIRLRKAGQKVAKKKEDQVRLRDTLKYRNVLLSSINSIPVMGWLYVYTSFSSLFLTKVHGFDMWSVGLIVSASGLGGFLGEFILGSVSDVIGRKRALILAALLCAGFGILVAVMPVGTNALVFGAVFFLFGLFGAGMYPMYLGTLPAESVPPEISGTAVAVPVAVGETLGAALMPTIAGVLSDHINLFAPMWMAALSGIFIAAVSIFYVETAPRRIARMKHKPTREDHLLKAFRPKQTAETSK
jgi:MFS family permease